MAIEDKKAITRNVIAGASAFIMVHTLKLCSPTGWRGGRAIRKGKEAASVVAVVAFQHDR